MRDVVFCITADGKGEFWYGLPNSPVHQPSGGMADKLGDYPGNIDAVAQQYLDKGYRRYPWEGGSVFVKEAD